MPRVLIIAYGNPLRSDDGLAWRAADQLEGKFHASDVEILRRHQLMPELAETISHAEAVIFLDAAPPGSGRPGKIRCAENAAIDSSVPTFSHHLTPAALLRAAGELYAVSPRAYSVTLTGENFDHGESLSTVVESALPQLAAEVETLVRKIMQPRRFR